MLGTRRMLMNKRLTGALAGSCLAVLAALPPLAGPARADKGAPAVWSRIEAAPILDHIKYLSSDALEGRRTGEPGCDTAAVYIARQFHAAALKPLGDDGTYLQHFDATVGVKLGPGNRLAAAIGGGAETAFPDSDYAPMGFAENGAVPATAVVFVGYGITAPDKHYDDYAGADVKGKIVLFFRHIPGEMDSTGLFGKMDRSPFADLRYKANNAFNHGAVAALVILDPLHHKSEPDEPVKLQADQGVGGAHIPVMSLRRSVADAVCKGLQASLGAAPLEALQAGIDSTRASHSIEIPGARVALQVDLNRDRRHVANVVGMLEGADPALKDQCIVVGAHYDHLGWGGQGALDPDQHAIHHGADDNASGSAAVMDLARQFAQPWVHSKRSLIFICFTGEEEGLFGSSYFAGHPPVAMDKISAMINMDMIGRLKGNRLTIGGTGTSPEFKPLLDQEAAPESLTYASQESGYGPSDHTSFYAKDRPVLFFFTGAHADYHKATDTWDKINAEGEARIERLVARVAERLADQNESVAFTHVLADTSRSQGGEGIGSAGSGYGPYLGTIPDFGDNPEIKGVLLSGVREGSPAAKAGIQGGDVIVKFGGVGIGNLYDYTYALRDHKPGDIVEIELLRKEQRVTVHATLGKRR